MLSNEKAKLEKVLSEMAARETAMQDAAVEAASAEHEYRLAKARAYLNASGDQKAREAQAVIATEKELLARNLAEYGYEVAREKVRDVRQAVSARQTLASNERELDKIHAQIN